MYEVQPLAPIVGGDTMTTIDASPNPAQVGASVSFTASVRGTESTAVPAGSVRFKEGSTLLASVALDASGRASFSTSGLSAGTHTITANYGGSASLNPSSASVEETITAPAASFTLALAPSSVTLHAGDKATVAITLASVGQFTGPLTLSYGGLPMYASASFSSATVTLTPGATGSASLVLNTAGGSGTVAAVRRSTKPGAGPVSAALMGLTLMLLPLGGTRRKRFWKVPSLLAAVVLCGTLTGCSDLYVRANLVAAGTYQVMITATDTNGNSKTAPLTVVVVP